MLKRSKDTDNEQKEDISPDGAASDNVKLAPEQEVKTASAPSPDGELEKLRARLGDKDKELAELKDKYLRALAETENTRKRLRQQSEETVRLQRENLLRELLPIVDNLERALEAGRGGGNGKPIVEGVEMVLRGMLDFLKTHDVTQIQSIGELFDPARHEAVDHIATEQHPPNTVVNEFNRGYLIGQRMLRPARVSVARGPGENSDNQPDGNEVENG